MLHCVVKNISLHSRVSVYASISDRTSKRSATFMMMYICTNVCMYECMYVCMYLIGPSPSKVAMRIARTNLDC